MRVQNAVTLLACWLGVGSVLAAEAQSDPSPPTEALRFFEGVTDDNTGGKTLRTLRPSPASPADLAQALADVPQESVLEPTDTERATLAALDVVLAYHERQLVYVIKVIDVPMAAVNLHGRAVLLISRPALLLLSIAELQATVAHEIGHEYFWGAYPDLRARQDTVGLQVLELKCDGIAVLTLLELGIEPVHLYRATEKIGRFNEVPKDRWGKNGYPHPRDRERFIRALLATLRR
jgi:hypothetical protein